ncbi:MAG TPA: hypothetical protein VMV51_13375 [Gemmatimonadaceae bacterium]|nr:hypothetical protein [Gemmatimonadaceae bacterium]
MTVGDWLASRTPPAPAALAARVRFALGDRLTGDESATHTVCESAAEELLVSLLERRATGRETALDLLAADALVTYAFEHAAVAADDLDAEAAGAMQRIAAVGARFAAAERPA